MRSIPAGIAEFLAPLPGCGRGERFPVVSPLRAQPPANWLASLRLAADRTTRRISEVGHFNESCTHLGSPDNLLSGSPKATRGRRKQVRKPKGCFLCLDRSFGLGTPTTSCRGYLSRARLPSLPQPSAGRSGPTPRPSLPPHPPTQRGLPAREPCPSLHRPHCPGRRGDARIFAPASAGR
jgi:hypothetical protein